jgi:hypothetical protein
VGEIAIRDSRLVRIEERLEGDRVKVKISRPASQARCPFRAFGGVPRLQTVHLSTRIWNSHERAPTLLGNARRRCANMVADGALIALVTAFEVAC